MPLLLLPNLLDEEGSHELFLPISVDRAVSSIDGLIAESEKAARRFLKRFSFSNGRTFRDIPLRLLNEHTSDKELEALLQELSKGGRWGLVSDCGLPCLADPGSNLVLKARQAGIEVEAFVGPSSLFLALMLSGLGGQRFTFHGYLPKEETLNHLKKMQARSQLERSTEFFIEAPYRNRKLFDFLLKNLAEETLLCLAVDLTLPTQWVSTQSIRQWKKKSPPDIDKHPTVFLIRA